MVGVPRDIRKANHQTTFRVVASVENLQFYIHNSLEEALDLS
jgi:hypothetical protein